MPVIIFGDWPETHRLRLPCWPGAVLTTADYFRFLSEILSAEELMSLQLLAKAELLHDGLITIGIVRLEVVEQAPPLAHQHKKTAA